MAIYAIIFNGDNFRNLTMAGGLDVFIRENAKCVDDDEWPVDYYDDDSATMSSASTTIESFSGFVFFAFLIVTFFVV